MGDPDSFSDEMGSIFEEPEPELPPRSDLPALVAEFVPLNRRRVRGDPPLSLAEIGRWEDLRERLEYELGSSSPPLAGSHRRTLRVPTDLKVCTAGRAEAVSNLLNVCEGGAFIETAEMLEPGTRLALEIDPGNGESPLRLDAVVKWGREISNMDGPAGVGIEFQNLEDGDFAALERLVDHVLAALQRGGS